MQTEQQGRVVIEIAGEELLPLPNRCLYWPAQNTLFVADLHLGKGASFRASYVPVPTGSTQNTLARLSEAIEETGASKLVILGDLWHAANGRTEENMAQFLAWRHSFSTPDTPRSTLIPPTPNTQHPSPKSRNRGIEESSNHFPTPNAQRPTPFTITLVEGNHDTKSGPLPDSHGIEQVQPGTRLGPFELQHDPHDPESGYGLGGHLHPGVKLTGKADQSLMLPCFWFRENYGVLPSFGDFTGLARIRPWQGDEVFAVIGNTIRRL